jgi:hypothetical protein
MLYLFGLIFAFQEITELQFTYMHTHALTHALTHTHVCTHTHIYIISQRMLNVIEN